MDQMNVDLPLTLGYALPVALLAWIWLSSKTGIRIKLLVTLCLPLLYGAHWFGLQNLRGWPAYQSLPNQFQLLAADVVEPDPSLSDAGKINLWVRLTEAGEPRAYSLPYTRKLHQMLFDTKQRMQAGQTQFGRLYDSSSNRGAAIGNNQKLEFQNATRSILPEK